MNIKKPNACVDYLNYQFHCVQLMNSGSNFCKEYLDLSSFCVSEASDQSSTSLLSFVHISLRVDFFTFDPFVIMGIEEV